MKQVLEKILFIYGFIFVFNISAGTKSEINVRDFGAKGDGITLDTKAIQEAVDKCAESGGTVIFPSGKYLTGSIELKNNVDIYIPNGTTILGSTNIEDYFERQPELKSYNDIFLKHSLFYGEKLKNISIRGEGVIDGQGSFFKVTTKVKPDRYRNRPYIIRFIECENVRIENLTLQNSAMWMQQYLACTDLYISGIKVINHENQNNDMMDIDGCKNVIISDCIGDTDDDGIVLKSTSPHITENIVINNCIISSHCNAIKMGTESTGGFRNVAISNIVVKPSKNEKVIFGQPYGISGITLAVVDGGILDGVTISNIMIDGPMVPIFLRLGNRARKHKESAPTPPIGKFRNVKISNVIAKNIKSIGASISGIPDNYIEDVQLSDIKIEYVGGIKKDGYNFKVEELAENYPESTMWGNLPAYGFYIRHARGIKLNNISLSYYEKDERSAMELDDVKDMEIFSLYAKISPEANHLIGINNSKDIFIENSISIGKANYFLAIDDSISENIIMKGNDLRKFEKPFIQKVDGQVQMFNNIFPSGK
jgi:hypothetical protein